MESCDQQRLGAYHDEELGSAAREQMTVHLRSCSRCATELMRLDETRRLLQEWNPRALDARQLTVLHEAVDSSGDKRLWRVGATMGTLAASVLIIGAAWLREMPRRVDASTAAVAITPARGWERVAMTLRVDTVPREVTDNMQLADARMADWMLEGLSPEIRAPR